MIKAVAYARVSSKEQEKTGYSIPAQIKIIKEYSIDNNIKIQKIFKDSETAKKAGRKDFNLMLQFLKENSIKLILVEKTDRLYRNFKDYVTIDDLDIEVHLIKENQILSKNSRSHEKFIHGIKVLMAKNYIDNLSEEIKKGQLEALEAGRWIFYPPRGYSFTKQDGKSVIIQSDEALIIEECFQLISTGDYTVENARRKINTKYRIRIPKQTFHRILRNPFYYGFMKINTFPEKLFKGAHEPIISEVLFYKVQDVLSKNRTHHRIPVKDDEHFPLRGFVTCSKCGRPLTGSWSRGRRKKYAYYRCHGCNLNIKKETLEEKFVDQLTKLEPKREYLQLFDVIFRQVWGQHKYLQVNFKDHLKKQIKKLDLKKVRITDLLIDGTLAKDIYSSKVSEVNEDIHSKKIQLEDIEQDYKELEEHLRFAKFVMLNLSTFWIKVKDLYFRRKLQKLVFPEGISFDGEICRTAATPLIFNCLSGLNPKIKPITFTNKKAICRTAVNSIKINGLDVALTHKVPSGGVLGTTTEHFNNLNKIISEVKSFEILKEYENQLKKAE